MTATPVGADDAYNAGIFNHVVDHSEIDLKLEKIIQGILNCSPAGTANIKLQFNKIADSAVMKKIDLSVLETARKNILKSSELQESVQTMISKFSKHS